MGLLDIFKKKEESERKEKKGKQKGKKKAEKIKKEIPQEKELEEIGVSKKVKRVKKKEFSQAYQILRRPHITEKATNLEENNKYIFEVAQKANKIEVKKAVQDLYGVGVLDVNIINIHPKTKRVAGRRKGGGHKVGYKKAVVTLYPGEKIELMPR